MILFFCPGLFWEAEVWLYDGSKCLKRKIISKPSDENKELFEFLSGVDLNRCSAIICLRWMGRYMSLRLMWIVASTISKLKGIKLYWIPSYEYLYLRSECLSVIQINNHEFVLFDWINLTIRSQVEGVSEWYWCTKNNEVFRIETKKTDIKPIESIVWRLMQDKYLCDQIEIIY